ncbi:hypothetical protein A3D77_01790 [Candidatus Gottesmanbacteria bacterium RIFCSPHIGHO2_02_FULL_39_11]|uniref:histidine kinase n=1 Tax=Candidatus Gottesmanbacteria bacterium RIFCSPHIGHO2_02_FULL_39_11 TaxID=1798382 RepID=A0A1F5ZUI8_9BACT|nr:MAG: hypothetical protein A3D77_01790 [Candidatus Gottesmanbacteria bacterium RIFCSPHIGHO2_02_FULL_39_11]
MTDSTSTISTVPSSPITPAKNNPEVQDQLAKVNQEIYERNVELAVRNRTLDTLRKMYEIINTSFGIRGTAQRLTAAITEELKFKKVYLALLSQDKSQLKMAVRHPIQLSEEEIMSYFKVPFDQISIPLTQSDNLCIKCVMDKRSRMTNFLYDLLTPLIDEKQAEELQKKLKIETAIIFPIIFGKEVLGVLIVCLDKHIGNLSRAEKETLKEITEVLGLAIRNAELYTSLETTTDKLKRANIRLQELDKIKDEFVSVASHELRTPMTAIKSYLWMVLYKNMQPLDDKVHTYIFRAYESTERLIRLVQDMLTVSRIEGNRMELRVSDFNLYELIDQIVDEIKVKAGEKGIRLTFTRKVKDVTLHADRDKITEVIMNLLGNAVKYTHQGGFIDLSLTRKDNTIEISVKDTGTGISEADKSKLFQKFSRLEHSYTKMAENTGTGLGLYICRQIVSLHGGEIWVDSEVGKGSTFTFSIPQETVQGDSHAGSST